MNPFPIDKRLTAIAIGYQNTGFIADMVAPRINVGSEEFRYNEHVMEDYFNIPDTMVGRKSKTNEVEFVVKEKPGYVIDHGLSDVVPVKDINNAKNNPGFDPLGNAARGVTELVMLAREQRVATMALDADNYNNKAALSGSDKFSDPTSDVASIILTALEVPIVRPNTMILGRIDWFNIRRNKKLLQLIKGDVDADGLASRQQVADALELDNVYVGEARYNAANKGQAMNLSRLWNGAVALQYIKPLTSLQRELTFMASPIYGDRISFVENLDPGQAGLDGAKRVTVGEKVNELLISKEAGYLFTGTQ